MKNVSYTVESIEMLRDFLKSDEIKRYAESSKSILIQTFSSKTERKWIRSIADVIGDELPSAVLVGTSTVGEICEGTLKLGSTVLAISFFETSEIKPFAVECSPGSEFDTGKFIIESIDKSCKHVAGVLLLATPLTIDASKLLKGMTKKENNYPIFGGGAGVYESNKKSLIFLDKTQYKNGVIAVLFCGEELHVSAHTYLGWGPLSKEMTITKTDGMFVKKIDDLSAFDFYRRYLGIKSDKDFFSNVLEYPFLLDRDGEIIARTPFFVDEEGGLEFRADINEGEIFRVGYGNPLKIVENSKEIQKVMQEFKPDAIFLYTCLCRRYLMKYEVDLETQPFEKISPTTGFYTYGEFFGHGDKINILNSTMVVVGMREEKAND